MHSSTPSKNKLSRNIFIGLLAGIVLGYIFYKQAIAKSYIDAFSLVPEVFLRLIKMIVAPLVFSTLVVGIAKLGDIKSVGRIGAKTLLWFF
jgi:Na+/H+-dicarboxylate symporter